MSVSHADDADTLDGTHKAGLLTALSSSSGTNLSLTVGGTTKTVADLYATYADRLRTARTLWGQSFNGTANVSGALVDVTNITMSGTLKIGDCTIVWDSATGALHFSHGIYSDSFVSAKGKNSDAGSATAGATTLNGLDDVAISSPANGQSLVYRNGTWKNETVSGGGSATVNWDDIDGKPTWIGSSKPSYSFSEITGTPSLSISSSNATNLSINVEGASKSITALYASYLGGTTKAGLFTGLTYSGNTLTIVIGGTKRTATIEAGGGGVSSVSVTSTSSRNLSVTVDGVTDYVNDLYATTAEKATQLQTARTLWGQPFNGTANVSGAMTDVDSLTFTPGTNSSNLILSGNGIRFIPATGGWGRNISFWNRANTSNIGTLCGAFGSNDTLNYLYYGGTSYTDPAIAIRANKNVGIGTTNPSHLLHVAGSAYATGGFQDGSDIRFKHILRDIPLTVEDVADAPSFIFRWTDDTAPGEQAGTSAQYWQPLLPQVVHTADDGRLSMQYGKAAMAAVITTARTVVDHETRIRQLEKENLTLKEQITLLERRIA